MEYIGRIDNDTKLRRGGEEIVIFGQGKGWRGCWKSWTACR